MTAARELLARCREWIGSNSSVQVTQPIFGVAMGRCYCRDCGEHDGRHTEKCPTAALLREIEAELAVTELHSMIPDIRRTLEKEEPERHE